MIAVEQPTGAEAITFFKEQGRKEPGTWGFWEVWGCSVRDLRVGDILLSKTGDTDEVEVDYVVDLFRAKSDVRRGFVNHEDKRLTVGLLAPVIICRWGQHATLSEYVR